MNDTQTAARDEDLRFAVAEALRDWIHTTDLSQCGPGADTCPDWDLAFRVRDEVMVPVESALAVLEARVVAAEAQYEDARHVITVQHSKLYMLGLDTHEGEEPQTREDCHRNLDAMLDGDIEEWPNWPSWQQVDEANQRFVAAEARVVAAEAERDELRDACHLTAKSAERRLERAEAAEGRLQAATDALREMPLKVLAAIDVEVSELNEREIAAVEALVAGAVLVGGTDE